MGNINLFRPQPLRPHWLAVVGIYADDGFGNRYLENKPARLDFKYENTFDYSYGSAS